MQSSTFLHKRTSDKCFKNIQLKRIKENSNKHIKIKNTIYNIYLYFLYVEHTKFSKQMDIKIPHLIVIQTTSYTNIKLNR